MWGLVSVVFITPLKNNEMLQRLVRTLSCIYLKHRVI
jgi:hypothetical protein